MSTNFANLQAEYDIAQDSIEVLKKEAAALTKDLKSSIEQTADLKKKLAESEEKLGSLKAQKEDLEKSQITLHDQVTNLNYKGSDQVSLFLYMLKKSDYNAIVLSGKETTIACV